jgi:hypothetical protein
MPYPALAARGLKIRPGQTSLTVAAPGVGKSQFWANLAHRMRVPTLYWSADTDQSDVTMRTLALHCGLTVAEVEANLTDDSWREWMFEKLGHQADHIEWVFDSPITGRHLGERLNAYAALHGEYPALTVVDNLSNTLQTDQDEYQQIKAVQTQFQALARETKSHIASLHHAKGEYDSGTKPIPQSGGLQNPFKIPEVGLTLYRPDEDNRLAVNIVKIRGGRSDPAAKYPISLSIDFARAAVLGFTPGKEDQ